MDRSQEAPVCVRKLNGLSHLTPPFEGGTVIAEPEDARDSNPAQRLRISGGRSRGVSALPLVRLPSALAHFRLFARDRGGTVSTTGM
jgi:hypothetical protein